MARNSVVLAKSINPDRITANRNLVELDADDVALIKKFSDDLQADCERMKGLGAQFTMPPTDVQYAWIATLNDTCGNLIQATQVKRW